MTNEELYHFGVLGMKWGTRRGASAASVANTKSKAIKKMIKLDAKADKKQAKATRAKYSLLRTKASADRTQRRANKKAYKAYDWYKKAEKVLGEKTMSNVTNSKGVNLGKKYADWAMRESNLGQARVDTLKLFGD